MAIIDFKNVTKRYGENVVLDDFTLKVEERELIVLLGPSGCGKTTILKMINGLLFPTEGEVRVKGRLLSDWNLIDLRRNIGYVIQQIGLFPHLNIEDNINYVLDLNKTSNEKKKATAEKLIELVGMNSSFLKRYPSELSGGQQQRIGVARALAADPEIILMDEPFGALDEITRRNLQDELLEIHRKLEKTIVFVTHDIEEAIKLGSRIVLLNEGIIDIDKKKKDFILSKERSQYARDFFQSKDFIAYLNTVKVKDVAVLGVKESADYLKIPDKSSILYAIRKCIETQNDILAVADDNDEIRGYFSFKEFYKNL